MSRWRNCLTAVSLTGREQKSHTTTEDDLVSSRSLFWQTRMRELTPANVKDSVLVTIHGGVEYFELNRSRLECLPATKNHQGGRGDSDFETGQQPAPHISLNWCQGSHSKLNWMLIGFLSKIFWPWWHLSHGHQSFLLNFHNCNVQVHNYNSSRWLKLESSSNFLTKAEYPSFDIWSLNYRWFKFSFSRLPCFAFKFFIQLNLQTACMPCDF